MAYALVTNGAAGSGTGGTFTSGAFDTSGANLLVVAVSSYRGATAPTLSDSKSNTWHALNAYGDTYARIQFFYADAATVGTGHTFTLTGAGAYASLAMQAYSGSLTSSAPADQQNGATDTSDASTSRTTGSITPTEDNELIVSATSCGANGTLSVNSSLSITNQLDRNANYLAIGAAYIVQTTASAINVTWTTANTGGTLRIAAAIASFKAGTVSSGVPKQMSYYLGQMNG